ncbi:hypothetical protein CR513_48556, partial [Mucuna pruriens]
MASLQLTPFTLFRQRYPTTKLSTGSQFKPRARLGVRALTVRSYKVVIEHEGQSTELEVEPDETILSKALDSGLPVPHDCRLGVCMTCPARLISGSVDQSEGMLSDDVVDRVYNHDFGCGAKTFGITVTLYVDAIINDRLKNNLKLPLHPFSFPWSVNHVMDIISQCSLSQNCPHSGTSGFILGRSQVTLEILGNGMCHSNNLASYPMNNASTNRGF